MTFTVHNSLVHNARAPSKVKLVSIGSITYPGKTLLTLRHSFNALSESHLEAHVKTDLLIRSFMYTTRQGSQVSC